MKYWKDKKIQKLVEVSLARNYKGTIDELLKIRDLEIEINMCGMKVVKYTANLISTRSDAKGYKKYTKKVNYYKKLISKKKRKIEELK